MEIADPAPLPVSFNVYVRSVLPEGQPEPKPAEAHLGKLTGHAANAVHRSQHDGKIVDEWKELTTWKAFDGSVVKDGTMIRFAEDQELYIFRRVFLTSGGRGETYSPKFVTFLHIMGSRNSQYATFIPQQKKTNPG